MDPSQSATVRQFRRNLIQIPQLLVMDGRTKEAKIKDAQWRLLICMATDEELEQMAKIAAELFHYPVDQVLKDLKKSRAEYIKTKESWRKELLGPKQ
ncbi:unnamed protein product [marine sediment metagenome]|uniref:Uncharacterized protein n=1 Tax=marine sediment metagenome TaxID=412755 RepID=X1KYP8_9ZZZZ